jgi:hypothetical protein
MTTEWWGATKIEEWLRLRSWPRVLWRTETTTDGKKPRATPGTLAKKRAFKQKLLTARGIPGEGVVEFQSFCSDRRGLRINSKEN